MTGHTPDRGLQALRLMVERRRAKVRLQEERLVHLADCWSRTEPKLRLALDLVNAVLAESVMRMRVVWATDDVGLDAVPVNWSNEDPKVSLGATQYDRDRWHVLCRCQLQDVPSGKIGELGLIIAVNDAGRLSISAESGLDSQAPPLQDAGPIDDLSVEAFADLIAEGMRGFIGAEPHLHEGIPGRIGPP